MSNKMNIWRKIIDHIRSFKIGQDDYEYAITFGLLGSFFIFVKGLFSYVFVNHDKFTNPSLYLVYVILMGIYFVLIALIHSKVLKKELRVSHIVVDAFPFVIALTSSLLGYLYKDATNQLFSFTILMIFISWIQIFPRFKRILVFSIAFIALNSVYVIINGFDANVVNYVGLSSMAVLVAFVTSSIQCKIYHQQKHMIIDFSDTISELESTYTKLVQSHNVTASMLKLTQEVLQNDKIEDVLQLVLDEALNLIPNSQAGSILVLRENDQMEYIAARGYKLENLKRINLTYKDLYQSSFEDPYQPTIIRNLKTFDEAHIGEEKTQEIFTEAVNVAKSCLTCSFKRDGKFYGSINIDNFDSEEIYTDQDSYLLKQLAQELEIIISIHNLYEKAIRPTKYDELTNAKTRLYCMKLLHELLQNHQSGVISICTMDVNQLKSINDQYGHDVGDRYLVEFANSIEKANLQNHIFGRIGGDEFLLIFNGLDYQQSLEQVAKVKEYLKNNPFIYETQKIEITFATGVAVYPVDSDEIGTIIKLSDKRMYEDKRYQLKQ